jgi:hypothetical protein
MKVLLMFLIVLGTLTLFNPDQGDFAAYMEERAQTAVSDNARQSSGGILDRAPGRVQQLAASDFKRSSYLVFSTYTVDLHGTPYGVDWRYIGVGGQFFTLKRPSA